MIFLVCPHISDHELADGSVIAKPQTFVELGIDDGRDAIAVAVESFLTEPEMTTGEELPSLSLSVRAAGAARPPPHQIPRKRRAA